MSQNTSQDAIKELMLQLRKTAHERPLTEEELSQLNDNVPGLDATLGLCYTHMSNGQVKAVLRVGAQHMQPWGLVNGGVYCSIAESTASLAGVIAAGKPVVGVNNNTNFIKGVSSGVIEATATPIQLGGRTQIWTIDMFNNGTLVATSQLRTMVMG